MSTPLDDLRASIIEIRDALLERSKAYAATGKDCHAAYSEQFRKLSEVEAQRLAALDALIAERDAAKARAEKAEAERDALRKALEPFAREGLYWTESMWGSGEPIPDSWNVRISSPMCDSDDAEFTFGDLRRAHAALHGTAKPEPKPRTCGECANQSACELPFDLLPDTCGHFQPRADAQKGANE